MPALDDEQFEAYLKQFRPVAPTGLPAISPARKPQRAWRLAALIAAAVVVVSIMLTIPPKQSVLVDIKNPPGPKHIAENSAFTIRNANKLLADAPSFKSAVNDLAFKSGEVPLANNEQSAIYVLGKEKFKL